jgi:hypothetical protein
LASIALVAGAGVLFVFLRIDCFDVKDDGVQVLGGFGQNRPVAQAAVSMAYSFAGPGLLQERNRERPLGQRLPPGQVRTPPERP